MLSPDSLQLFELLNSQINLIHQPEIVLVCKHIVLGNFKGICAGFYRMLNKACRCACDPSDTLDLRPFSLYPVSVYYLLAAVLRILFRYPVQII